jgi:hypothetical protein
MNTVKTKKIDSNIRTINADAPKTSLSVISWIALVLLLAMTLAVGIMIIVNKNTFWFDTGALNGKKLSATFSFAITFTIIAGIVAAFHIMYLVFHKLDKYSYSNVFFLFLKNKFGAFSYFIIYGNFIGMLLFLIIGITNYDGSLTLPLTMFIIYYCAAIVSAFVYYFCCFKKNHNKK